MKIIKPLGFWQRYKENIIDLIPDLTKYHSPRIWTALTREAAIKAIESESLEPIEDPLGRLKTSKEYFRVDVIGHHNIGSHDWLLRIAFEHENEYSNDQWNDELCKLTHVVADLRVLAAYFDSDERQVRSKLQARVDLLQKQANRMTRVPDSSWLFIFGPAGKAKERGEEFLIYTIENHSTVKDAVVVVRLADDNPLIPANW